VTGLTLTADTVARLARHPNILGIKETSTDAAQIAAYIDGARGETFAVLAGSGPGFYAALCLGATGAILATACVVPRACVALFDAFQRGALDEARDLQRRIIPITLAITSGFGVPALKAALDRAGYRGGDPRPPLRPAPPDAIAAVTAALAPLQEFL
jgi:4-hydroxy-2-oxoglutarate aldolase